MDQGGWEWDPTLYAGSARYYAQGRVPYADALIECLVKELRLDGGGRLLDVGCGPGSLTLPLAAHVGWATGLDADSEMLTEAARRARKARVENVDWPRRAWSAARGTRERIRTRTIGSAGVRRGRV